MTITEFEAAVFAQKPTGQQHYDENYWLGEWRAGDNNYSLEARRRIEAKNPQLIKDVFQPTRVIDLGCGPGALMHLLHEIGVHADGIDYNEMSLKLATPEVKDRIAIGDATDASIGESAAYDLVICREVLEHLTVLEVKKAVANMVRLASKFIYVTTRFHPNPPTLLDFNTSDDLDPSHITLLNKDMLRLMFVLEGCRSRPDLEARMDWGNKGRVLVLEKERVIQGGVQRLALYALPAGACAWWAGPVLWRMTQHGDFPAHARFAEEIAATGQTTIPHFGYELGLIAVHAVWPGAGWSWAGFVVTLAGQMLTAGLLAHWIVRSTPECGRALRLAVAAVLPLALLIAQPVLPASGGERDPWLIGYFPPNQYHNPTTLLSKPVALALVGVGVAALSGTQARIAASAALVVVSGLIKPSFLMAFLPAAGALALVYWRRARWSLLIAGMAVPASLLLVAQFALRYQVQAGDGVSILWAPLMVLGLYGPTDAWSLAEKLLRSVLFPVLVTALFLPGARRDLRLVLAWVMFATGIAYGYVLAEGGGKASAGDFLWSGQLAAFTLFAAAAAFLVAQIPTAGESRRRPFIDKRIELCVLVLGWHVVSGLQHLRRSWLE